ncbi:hypothetical protein AMATHDRAFT_69732 [Amanita thiersii Skay4041]|uniref:Uncharacterized protein n=1 Tax=Amanita thiersii Skay4041 TaxID=703135 RepID=A0A2A9NE33_9AGAR|nr:hypothetical protein AMATHDRAFT_69732 [Amanita thiersii Skay4041]
MPSTSIHPIIPIVPFFQNFRSWCITTVHPPYLSLCPGTISVLCSGPTLHSVPPIGYSYPFLPAFQKSLTLLH